MAAGQRGRGYHCAGCQHDRHPDRCPCWHPALPGPCACLRCMTSAGTTATPGWSRVVRAPGARGQACCGASPRHPGRAVGVPPISLLSHLCGLACPPGASGELCVGMPSQFAPCQRRTPVPDERSAAVSRHPLHAGLDNARITRGICHLHTGFWRTLVLGWRQAGGIPGDRGKGSRRPGSTGSRRRQSQGLQWTILEQGWRTANGQSLRSGRSAIRSTAIRSTAPPGRQARKRAACGCSRATHPPTGRQQVPMARERLWSVHPRCQWLRASEAGACVGRPTHPLWRPRPHKPTQGRRAKSTRDYTPACACSLPLGADPAHLTMRSCWTLADRLRQ
jgi:hypothetical protein